MNKFRINLRNVALIVACLAVSMMLVSSCKKDKKDDNGDNPFVGTWNSDDGVSLDINASRWVLKNDNAPYCSGTYEYTGNTATLKVTDVGTRGGAVKVGDEGTAVLSGNGETMTVSGFGDETMDVTFTKEGGGGGGGGGGDGTIDWTDPKNAFVIIGGVKYQLYDKYTVQDFLNAGYTVDPELDINQEYSVFDLNGPTSESFLMYKNGEGFGVIPAQYWNIMVLKDYVISGFIASNMSVAGGLKPGQSTRDDVLKLFGAPSSQNSIMLFYGEMKYDIFYTFYFMNSDNMVSSIEIQCFF